MGTLAYQRGQEMLAVTKGDNGSQKGWQQINRDAGADTGPLRILYVEDDLASQMLVQQAFRHRSEWQIVIARSIEEGLQQLSPAPDVILLDINLPDGRGFELLAHVRADEALQHIPVIALTSCAMRTQVEEGLRAGFFQYLVKPVDLNHLFAAIEAAVL